MQEKLSPSLEIAAEIARLHVIFTSIFPHAGLIAVGGAIIFSESKELVQISRLVKKVENWCKHNSADVQVTQLWRQTYGMLSRVIASGKKSPAAEVGTAFKLLFATSGVMYMWLRERFADVACRQTYDYIELTRDELAKKSGFRELKSGTLTDAIIFLSQSQRSILKSQAWWKRWLGRI